MKRPDFLAMWGQLPHVIPTGQSGQVAQEDEEKETAVLPRQFLPTSQSRLAQLRHSPLKSCQQHPNHAVSLSAQATVVPIFYRRCPVFI